MTDEEEEQIISLLRQILDELNLMNSASVRLAFEIRIDQIVDDLRALTGTATITSAATAEKNQAR